MRKRLSLCMVVMCVALCASAQGNIVKPLVSGEGVGRALKQGAELVTKRAVRQAATVASPSVMREIMNPRSPVGSPLYEQARQVYLNPPVSHQLSNTLRRAVTAIPRPLAAEYVAEKTGIPYSVAQYAQTPVDGYVDSAENEIAGQKDFLKEMEEILAAAYPAEERRYWVGFVPSIGKIRYMLATQTRADQMLSWAMNRAYQSALYGSPNPHQSGFFVIGMASHEKGPMREAFVLDLKNKRWISYNKSRAEGWREILRNYPLSEKGALLVYDHPENTQSISTPKGMMPLSTVKVLSFDGFTGIILSPEDQMYVKRAMMEGYYIYFEPVGDLFTLPAEVADELGVSGLYGDYNLLFAISKGGNLYAPSQLLGKSSRYK